MQLFKGQAPSGACLQAVLKLNTAHNVWCLWHILLRGRRPWTDHVLANARLLAPSTCATSVHISRGIVRKLQGYTVSCVVAHNTRRLWAALRPMISKSLGQTVEVTQLGPQGQLCRVACAMRDSTLYISIPSWHTSHGLKPHPGRALCSKP